MKRVRVKVLWKKTPNVPGHRAKKYAEGVLLGAGALLEIIDAEGQPAWIPTSDCEWIRPLENV
jgi:hypothetical protein